MNKAIVAGTLAFAFILKRSYATATLDDLDWILAPTTRVVELLTGATFVREAGAGFISRELGFCIAPVCAGVNFLVVAFVTLALGHAIWIRSDRAKVLLFACSPLLAWCAAILANATRITLAIWLHTHRIEAGWFTASRVHELAGVGVYLGALMLLTLGAGAMLAGQDARRLQ